MLPVRLNTHWSGWVLQLCSSGSRHQLISRQIMTMIALRAVQMNQTTLSRIKRLLAGSWLVNFWMELVDSPLIGLNHLVLLMA